MARALSYRAESLRELAGGDEIGLLRCPACDVRFCDPLVSVDYAEADERGAKFYLECGAGIDVMLGALSLADARPVRHYLEIGCAFGFILDYARRMLGWQVRGFDPGGLARLGRNMLDLPIENGFFQAGRGFDDWADLVFCSEVIEHIPEPGPFLDLLGSALRPDGQLILTTPNGDALRQDAEPAVLSAILSPGHHILLYNPASIEALLKRHGFSHVRVEENGFQLRVAAARTPLAGRAGWAGRERFRDYLRAVAAEHGAEQPLGAGLAYRLFKEEVNQGRFAEAEEPWQRLREAYRRRYGFDCEDPAGMPLPQDGISFEECGERWPFNLCGLLYFRGVAEWLGRSKPAEAVPFFLAAGRVGAAMRHILRTAGVDDLEMADLGRQAFLARLSALAQCAPEAALDALNGEAPDAAAANRLFVDLVNLGHLDVADAVREGGALDSADPAVAAALAAARRARFIGMVSRGEFDDAERFLTENDLDGTDPPVRRALTVYWQGRLLILGQSDPEAAVGAYGKLEASLKSSLRRGLFTDLVNLGHLTAAGRVLGEEGLALPDEPAAADLPAFYALAMFQLLGKSDFAAASSTFGRVAAQGETAYYWQARFHQGLAARLGGDPAAETIAAEMENPAAGLPPVPDDLKSRLGELR